MKSISKSLDSVIKKTYSALVLDADILPVNSTQGIQVGRVTIVSRDNFKDLYIGDRAVFTDICLNKVAVLVANLLAVGNRISDCQQLLQADQHYKKWWIDWQNFAYQLQQARLAQDFERCDILSARLNESFIRAKHAKIRAHALAAKIKKNFE